MWPRWTRRRNFTVWRREQLWNVSRSLLALEKSPEECLGAVPSCRTKRDSMGTSAFFLFWKSIWSTEDISVIIWNVMRPGRRELRSSTIPTPRFACNPHACSSVHRIGGIYSINRTKENSEVCCNWNSCRKITRAIWLSVLESQLQDRSVRKHMYSWIHHLVDSCDENVWIFRRSFDVAICQRRVFSWCWGAWCDFRVCAEEDHFHFQSQKTSQYWRTASSRVQPVLEIDVNCLNVLWPL